MATKNFLLRQSFFNNFLNRFFNEYKSLDYLSYKRARPLFNIMEQYKDICTQPEYSNLYFSVHDKLASYLVTERMFIVNIPNILGFMKSIYDIDPCYVSSNNGVLYTNCVVDYVDDLRGNRTFINL